MKQLFKTGLKKFVVEEVPAPQSSDDEILIEVYYSLISSGTETMGVKGKSAPSGIGAKVEGMVSNAKRAYDFISEKGTTELLRKLKSRENIATTSGYSVAGKVVKVGKNITKFEIGDRVAAAGSGIASHAELVSIPRNLVAKLPDNVDFEDGAFTTIGSIALQGVRQAEPQVGETVVVIGLGLIGLITVQILKSSGCRVIGVDLDKNRVALGRELGLDFGFVDGENTPVEDINKITDNQGADAVIITAATSSNAPVNGAMRMTRKRGKVVIVGAVGMEINRSPFYEKEIDFKISCSYGPGRYDPDYEDKGIDYPYGFVRWTENRNMQAFLWLVSEGLMDLKKLVTDRFDISDAASAYEKILSDPSNTLGVLLRYDTEEEKKFRTRIDTPSEKITPIKKDAVNLAVIGAGGFASRTYLPTIYKSKEMRLKAIATKTGKNAKKMANDFGAEYSTTDYNEILNDKDVDAVIIASRHNLHFQMALDSLNAGKHVLLEKPMGLNIDEVSRLKETAGNKNLILSVGYNRRYSPLSVDVKKQISREQGPLFINYRVNAGYIPLSSWVHDKNIGGGRIIGEACHFYDLFNYFIGKEVVESTAQYIPVNEKTVVARDNFVSTHKFSDGSLAVLTYVSMGNKLLPKEYIEVFVNGKTMILDDFLELKFYGFKESDILLKTQNKGQVEQLYQFVNKLKGQESSLLSVEEAAWAAELSIQVDDYLS